MVAPLIILIIKILGIYIFERKAKWLLVKFKKLLDSKSSWFVLE